MQADVEILILRDKVESALDVCRPFLHADGGDVEIVAIRDGGVVAIPTDTLYGLAADPFNSSAVKRVFEAKRRPDAQPLLLVAESVAQVARQIGSLTADATRLAERFWPGPLTLLLAAPPTLAPGVTAGSDRIGVRVPAHEVPRALCRATARLLTATSANVSGAPPPSDPDVVERAMGGSIDVLLDAGATPGGSPSTLVDVTEGEPHLVRAGAVPWEEVRACLRRA